jgi:hypothetical protein
MEARGSIPSVRYIVFRDANAPDMVFEVSPRGNIRQSDAGGFPRALPTFREPAHAAHAPLQEPRIQLPHISELGTLHDRVPRCRHFPEHPVEFAGQEPPFSDEFPGPVLIPLGRRLPLT